MLSFIELGDKMLAAHGEDACEAGYATSDPYWVGRFALDYGDINGDGTLN
ncbi:hypothetical protein [Brevibacterium sp. CFH 10365]|nr:hypothetical protein [Brevibacterium sp. CFH 10365]